MLTLTDIDITTLQVDAIAQRGQRAVARRRRRGRRYPPGRRPGTARGLLGHRRLPHRRGGAHLGFRLPARYVIHTVGPVWRGGAATRLPCWPAATELPRDRLGQRYRLAAFPATSSGARVYGEAARIAVQTIRAFVREHGTPREVLLVCFTPEVRAAYTRALQAAD